jgi:diguanylate cyclase (GGDEF)-like protein
MTPAHAIGGAAPSDDDLTVVARAPEPVTSPVLDQLRMLLRADGAATLLLGMDATVLDVNDVARARLGLDDDDPLEPDGPGRSVLRSLLDQVPQRLFSDPAGGTWHGEVDLTHDGVGVVLDATVLVHHDASSPHGGFVAAIARDVSELHQRVDRLQHDLHHDAVTGLMNRIAALAEITEAVERDGGTHVAVLVIDVDRLADVNDALGHEIGDRLLASTAKRLASAVRPDDTVARIGGDEFMVLCHDVADVEVASELADRIRRALTGRLTIKDLELDVSVSIGVAIVTPDLMDQAGSHQAGSSQAGSHQAGTHRAVELLTRADTAVRAAKHDGRGRTAVWNDRLRSTARQRTELAAALSRALRHEELTIEYQPIFSAVSEQAEAAEALVRWDHPTRGRMEANEFVGVAEDTGIILAIGEWVLRQACADTRHWIDTGIVGQRFAVHVNVSRLQLTSPTFVNNVVELLREHQLRPRQLVLEARETTLLGESADVARTVRALRRVGVRVALDNFGTGANALSILTDIGADVLKLDGGLALPTGASDADTRVVRALVLLAHALNMDVVAERVTGLEQLRRLRAAGCDLVQGHLLGRPCPREDFHVYGRPSG